MQDFVRACTTCCQKKVSQPESLSPSAIMHQPCSHIALDFLTGLPPSDEKTAIATVVDQFSKMAHFVLLEKLQSAKETAQLLL